jgi:hypothetical protein
MPAGFLVPWLVSGILLVTARVTESLEDFKRYVCRLLETEMYRVGILLYGLGVFRGALGRLHGRQEHRRFPPKVGLEVTSV